MKRCLLLVSLFHLVFGAALLLLLGAIPAHAGTVSLYAIWRSSAGGAWEKVTDDSIPMGGLVKFRLTIAVDSGKYYIGSAISNRSIEEVAGHASLPVSFNYVSGTRNANWDAADVNAVYEFTPFAMGIHNGAYEVQITGEYTESTRLIPPYPPPTPISESKTFTLGSISIQDTTDPQFVITWDPATMTGVDLSSETFHPQQDGTTDLKYQIRSAPDKTLIKELSYNGEDRPGTHSFTWDGKNTAGQTAPRGVYSITVSNVMTNTMSVGGDERGSSRSNYLTGTINSVTPLAASEGSVNFRVADTLTDIFSASASTGEIWVYDSNLTNIYTGSISGLTAGSAGTAHQEDISVPSSSMSSAGKYLFVLHVRDSDTNKYNTHTSRWAVESMYSYLIVDLDTDSNNDGTIDNTDDPIEEDQPGKFVMVNSDDDNANSTPDKDETGTVTGEDDLGEVCLRKLVGEPADGTVTLSATSGGTSIKLWTDSTKGTQITLPKTYTVSELPRSVWVEGISASTSGGVSLQLSYGGKTDQVTFTVGSVTIISPSEGSKCTFSSASPGVCDVSCSATAVPSDRTGSIAWSCEDIADTVESWPNGTTGGETLTLRLTGLPSSNSSFGNSWVKASAGSVSDTNNFKVFFPRDAMNNPGGVDPNWYYYWKQTSASLGTHHYLANENAYGEYYAGEDHFHIEDLASGLNSETGHTGIDTFAETCIHENLHKTHWANWHTLPDADGDWLPDIVEDANGNGIYDAGDPSDWQNANTSNPNIDDEDLLCYAAEHNWGCTANSQDWAYQGKQY